MKLLKFILCCLVSPLVVLSQNDEVEITGVVYAFTFPRPESDFLPLKNAEVFLKISDSIIVKQLTDVNGQYNFIVKSVNHIGVLYTKSTNKTYNKEKRQYCFFEDHNKVNIDLSKRKRYIANFQFKQYTDCMGWMPEFFFKKNSYKIDFIDSLRIITRLLEDFPKMTLQINGHSDTTEINPTELSYRRAEAVLTQLIEAGIDRKRLSSIGFGATRPVVSERIIKKAKANEKPTLRQLNCIVSFECTHFEIE